jgi:hypothetical protein
MILITSSLSINNLMFVFIRIEKLKIERIFFHDVIIYVSKNLPYKMFSEIMMIKLNLLSIMSSITVIN